MDELQQAAGRYAVVVNGTRPHWYGSLSSPVCELLNVQTYYCISRSPANLEEVQCPPPPVPAAAAVSKMPIATAGVLR